MDELPPRRPRRMSRAVLGAPYFAGVVILMIAFTAWPERQRGMGWRIETIAELPVTLAQPVDFLEYWGTHSREWEWLFVTDCSLGPSRAEPTGLERLVVFPDARVSTRLSREANWAIVCRIERADFVCERVATVALPFPRRSLTFDEILEQWRTAPRLRGMNAARYHESMAARR